MMVAGSGSAGAATTLKEMYDLAPAREGYDRYIILETGRVYTGGLWVGGTYNRITFAFEEGAEDVCIVGNGAILDLRGSEICCAYTHGRLDISDCVILNGNIRFRGYRSGDLELLPRGSVRYVTFFEPQDYGVRLFGCGVGIEVRRNLVVDPIDTGPDFMYLTGEPTDWLPTGSAFSLSMQYPAYEVWENWSFHTDPDANGDACRHFPILCDYG